MDKRENKKMKGEPSMGAENGEETEALEDKTSEARKKKKTVLHDRIKRTARV